MQLKDEHKLMEKQSDQGQDEGAVEKAVTPPTADVDKPTRDGEPVLRNEPKKRVWKDVMQGLKEKLARKENADSNDDTARGKNDKDVSNNQKNKKPQWKLIMMSLKERFARKGRVDGGKYKGEKDDKRVSKTRKIWKGTKAKMIKAKTKVSKGKTTVMKGLSGFLKKDKVEDLAKSSLYLKRYSQVKQKLWIDTVFRAVGREVEQEEEAFEALIEVNDNEVEASPFGMVPSAPDEKEVEVNKVESSGVADMRSEPAAPSSPETKIEDESPSTREDKPPQEQGEEADDMSETKKKKLFMESLFQLSKTHVDEHAEATEDNVHTGFAAADKDAVLESQDDMSSKKFPVNLLLEIAAGCGDMPCRHRKNDDIPLSIDVDKEPTGKNIKLDRIRSHIDGVEVEPKDFKHEKESSIMSNKSGKNLPKSFIKGLFGVRPHRIHSDTNAVEVEHESGSTRSKQSDGSLREPVGDSATKNSLFQAPELCCGNENHINDDEKSEHDEIELQREELDAAKIGDTRSLSPPSAGSSSVVYRELENADEGEVCKVKPIMDSDSLREKRIRVVPVDTIGNDAAPDNTSVKEDGKAGRPLRILGVVPTTTTASTELDLLEVDLEKTTDDNTTISTELSSPADPL